MTGLVWRVAVIVCYSEFSTISLLNSQSYLFFLIFNKLLALPASYLLHGDKFENPQYPSIEQSTNQDSSYYTASLDNQQAFFMGPSLTVAAQQKYTIKDICPAWGYTTEYTKVDHECPFLFLNLLLSQ